MLAHIKRIHNRASTHGGCASTITTRTNPEPIAAGGTYATELEQSTTDGQHTSSTDAMLHGLRNELERLRREKAQATIALDRDVDALERLRSQKVQATIALNRDVDALERLRSQKVQAILGFDRDIDILVQALRVMERDAKCC